MMDGGWAGPGQIFIVWVKEYFALKRADKDLARLRVQQRAFTENLAQLGPSAVLVHRGADGSQMAAWTGPRPSGPSPAVMMISDGLAGNPRVANGPTPGGFPVTGTGDRGDPTCDSRRSW